MYCSVAHKKQLRYFTRLRFVVGNSMERWRMVLQIDSDNWIILRSLLPVLLKDCLGLLQVNVGVFYQVR